MLADVFSTAGPNHIDWFKHILLNFKNKLFTQIYKHFKQWIRTKDNNLIEFFSRYNFSGELTSVKYILIIIRGSDSCTTSKDLFSCCD